MSPIPPFLVDLGGFLFNSASLIFQLASHKHICLEVLRIVWWDRGGLHENRRWVTAVSGGSRAVSEREKSKTSAPHSGSQPHVSKASTG